MNKNKTKSRPCLEISCETIFQPRITAHVIWCILHTACALLPGTDLKYNPTTLFTKVHSKSKHVKILKHPKTSGKSMAKHHCSIFETTCQTRGQTWWHVWWVARSACIVDECPCLQFVHVDGVVLVFVKSFYQLLDLSASPFQDSWDWFCSLLDGGHIIYIYI